MFYSTKISKTKIIYTKCIPNIKINETINSFGTYTLTDNHADKIFFIRF